MPGTKRARSASPKRKTGALKPLQKGSTKIVKKGILKHPGLRLSGDAILGTEKEASRFTHKGKDGKALKKPRVLYRKKIDPTCADPKFQVGMSSSGKMGCIKKDGEKKVVKRSKSPKKDGKKTKSTGERKVRVKGPHHELLAKAGRALYRRRAAAGLGPVGPAGMKTWKANLAKKLEGLKSEEEKKEVIKKALARAATLKAHAERKQSAKKPKTTKGKPKTKTTKPKGTTKKPKAKKAKKE